MDTKKCKCKLGMKAIVIGMLILLIVVLFAVYKIKQQPYKPVINKQPKQFINISGYISNHLDGECLLTYATNSESCKTSPLVTGAAISRLKTIKYLIKPDNKNKFQLSIPTDEILPGHCSLKIESFGLNISMVSKEKLKFEGYPIYFYNKVTRQKLKIKYQCRQEVTKDPGALQKKILVCRNNLRDGSIDVPYNINNISLEIQYKK